MTQEKPLVLEIRRACRAAARLVICFAGISGSGKTRTAIEFAYGLAGYDVDKMGFLDAENKRGELYSDVLKSHAEKPVEQTWWHGDLRAPFSPARYIDAIKQFEAAGVEVLIIDSATHEWEGDGGAQDIAENNKNPKSGKLNWAKAKSEHKKFMSALLQSNMHIVVCTRAREKTREYRDPKDNKMKVESLGIQPIQEKNFMFEMTASVMMFAEGQVQQVMKCPAELQPFLARQQGYITSADGYAVRQWVEGGGKVDQKVEKLRNALVQEAEGGVKHVISCWEKFKPAQQKAVGQAFFETVKASAAEYDDQRRQEEAAAAGSADAADLSRDLADE